MKILQLIDTLEIGGAERMSINIANVLQEKGIENHLIVSRKEGPLKKQLLPGISCHTLNKKNGLDLFAFIKLVRLVKNIKPEIIHAHSTSIFWSVALKFFQPSVKIIWHDHFGLSNHLDKNPRFGTVAISRLIDGVIAVNEILEKWAHSKLKIQSNKIQYIANFPYVNKLVLKNNNPIPIILILANFRPQKDHSTLIKALALLANKGFDFECFMAGNLGAVEYMSSLENEMKQLGIKNQMKILGPVENVSELLSTANLGVLCSESEGLPVSLLEYGLAGIPVVCTHVGQCATVLGNGNWGWLVPPKNPQALADSIIEILTNKNLAAEKAQKFHEHIVNEYGPNKFVSEYLQFITSIHRNNLDN